MIKTVAICDECWRKQEGEREPFRLREPEPETCYICDQPTSSGIYVRSWIKNPAEKLRK